MPAFQAINVEPEENEDDQIDTAKQLQVDEALKRFQNALKLHAQGSKSRDLAGAAYKELFESEIFGYPEAKTDFEREELQRSGQSPAIPPESFSARLDVDQDGADGIATTLSQALYMSHKNYGQFCLDKLQDRCSKDDELKQKGSINYDSDQGRDILDNWVAALDQDPSDPELWRRAARLAASMKSARLKRYCLEAAIELDDDPTVMDVEPPTLAETLAGEQLKNHLLVLDDEIALTHPIMKPWMRKTLAPMMRRFLDPIPFLPDQTATLDVLSTRRDSSPTHRRPGSRAGSEETSLERTESWSELGLSLMKHQCDIENMLQACRSILTDAEDSETKDAVECKSEPVQHDVAPPAVTTADADSGEQKPGRKVLPASVRQNEDDQAPTTTCKDRRSSMSLRKHGQSTAMADGNDEEVNSEKRSKRVRRRAEARDTGENIASASLQAHQIQPYQEADLFLFRTVKNLLESLGMEDIEALAGLQELIDSCSSEDRLSVITGRGARDLEAILSNFQEEVAMTLLNKKEQATLSLSAFLEHAQIEANDKSQVPLFEDAQGLNKFVGAVIECRDWISADDVLFHWVKAISESYTTFKWSDALKFTVVQMLNRTDGILYTRVFHELQKPISEAELAPLESLVPMVFELHIDIYERITNPSSAVDYDTRIDTKYRLDRWLDIYSTYVHALDRPHSDALVTRFLWAAVLASSLVDNPVREHILFLWTSLRDHLSAETSEEIRLPNNLVMPVISTAAADREISKLTTMDFFLGLFQEVMKDPVQVIENLEPVLNPSSVYTSCNGMENSQDINGDPKEQAKDKMENPSARPIYDHASQGLQDLWKFLHGSSTELRLFLWSRLGDAYTAINYPTKRFSCLLRSIELIVTDLGSTKYAETPEKSRSFLFMRMMRSLDELLVQALSMALNEESAFEIIDEDHIKQTTSALAKVNCVLHVSTLHEDRNRITSTPAPANGATYTSLMNKLREMQVRAWSLQYTMIKAGLSYNKDVINTNGDRTELLAVIHRAIGLRRFCKASNKIFLRMMRLELLQQSQIENWEDHLGQVLYDLHGLKLGVGLWEGQDHGCPSDNLERRQALQLVEKVMVLAHRMSMKDLLKSDLKTTIEHMQQTIGPPRSSGQMTYNLRNITETLKKTIHPLRLYQALSGCVSIDAVSAAVPEANLAQHGWYFLLGMMTLTKFKGVDLNRRQTPGATDDLRIGATFLKLQLQFTADNWEAWFRLAECFDYELDEAVLWTADKINKDRGDLIRFQRSAIHCYTLALSNTRQTELEARHEDALHDLYYKFAMRLYSSSREPFAMEPFDHSDLVRYFIEQMGAGTFKKILHEQMSEYQVWKFAAKLFRMAMQRRPFNWRNPYMLAKCYWKMYTSLTSEGMEENGPAKSVPLELLLEILDTSVQVATNARKSRGSEPILEPHYKIVSILHKLVQRGDLPAKNAASILAKQPLAAASQAIDDHAGGIEPEDWDELIIRNLIKLREKDKANWQHRIVMRHARIVFDGQITSPSSGGSFEAKAAFTILREHMFTKTMVMNVWKCDAERPGRHHVFTEQYVRFMTKILHIMKDRVNMELLLRRLRKRGADFYHFNDLWQSCCMIYLKLLRSCYAVPPASEDAFKASSSEDFEALSDGVLTLAAKAGPQLMELSCMREAIDMKKLNANLMKVAPIDDLIIDCYSKLYLDVASAAQERRVGQIAAELAQSQEAASQSQDVAAGSGIKYPLAFNGVLNLSKGLDIPAENSTPGDADKSESAPRARKAIRRPDILRKAEQVVLRITEPPRSATIKSRVGSASSKRGSHTPAAVLSGISSDDDHEGTVLKARRSIVDHGDQEMQDAEAPDEIGGYEDTDDINVPTKEDVDSGSALGGRSADEDSDLSDLPDSYDEEEVPPSLMFPNLGRPEEATETSGEEADSESEGAEEDIGYDADNTDEEEAAAADGAAFASGEDDVAEEDNEEIEEEGEEKEEEVEEEEWEEDGEEEEEEEEDEEIEEEEEHELPKASSGDDVAEDTAMTDAQGEGEEDLPESEL